MQKRPEVKAFVFADYDHDGSPELYLNERYEACGFYSYVAIGVDAKTDRLHALTTVEHPERPLLLQFDEWPLFLGIGKGAHQSATLVPCGDHGSDHWIDDALWWDDAGLHVTTRTYTCVSKKGSPPGVADARGALTSTEVR